MAGVRDDGAVELTDTIDIDAPADRVWEVLADVERWPEWTSSMRSVLIVKGPMGEGAVARVTQPSLPGLEWTVTEWVPGRSFTWVNRSPGMTSEGVHRIDERPGGVTVTLSIRQTGVVGEVLGRLFGGRSRRWVRMEAAGLKQRAEPA